MGFFDFFKSSKNKSSINKSSIDKSSIDLSNIKFLSDDHTRIENGQRSNKNNKGAWRGISITSNDNIVFYVTMHNIDGLHPVWQNNIQMAEKQMKLIEEDNTKIILRGFGADSMGNSFTDYGLTLKKSDNNISRITLHLHDRNVDIVYEKAEDKEKAEVHNSDSDFEYFKNFEYRWNSTMPRHEKIAIALKTDEIFTRGAKLYEDDDIQGAVQAFEEALKVMPINDDALKFLSSYYSQIGEDKKALKMKKKLTYLSR